MLRAAEVNLFKNVDWAIQMWSNFWVAHTRIFLGMQIVVFLGSVCTSTRASGDLSRVDFNMAD